MPRPRRPLAERFWEKVNKQPGDGCWEWTAALDRDGYGHFYMWKGCEPPAHRASWFLHYGEFPRPFPEFTLDHLCRNTSCVRPDHLEDVPHNENVARGEGKAAAVLRTGKCINGHKDWRTYPNGRRDCRACHRERHRARYANDSKFREKKKAASLAHYYARKRAEREGAA